MRRRQTQDRAPFPHRGDEPHLLREIVRTHQVLMLRFSRQVGMPGSRFALLRLLAVAGREMGIMELARQLGINGAAVTRQVQALAAEGLVQRCEDPMDGRRYAVRLSSKGRRRFAEIHDRSHELERALSTVIGAKEMQSAARVLEQLRCYLENLRG